MEQLINLHKFCFVSETKSQTIKISLKNDVLVHQGTFEGTYEMSTPVNGQPSWISSTNAIWCTSTDTDYWIIGKLESNEEKTQCGFNSLHKE